MFKTSLVLATALALAHPAVAQPVTSDALMRHIRVLADDRYEGRDPGTAGGERTEAYILEAFASAGLTGGGENGAWRQTIPMVERTTERHDLRFTAAGKPMPIAADSLALTGRDAQVKFVDAPVIFAGYGTAAEVSAVDVKGAVVLMLSGEPAGQAGGPYALARRMALAEAGAAAILAINPADGKWDRDARDWTTVLSPGRRTVALAQGLIAHPQAITLLRATGKDPVEMLASAARPDFRAVKIPVAVSADVTTKFRRFDTANIVGRIEGGNRSGEALILMGHWDHVGICAPPTSADRICNGAVDNASGIAVLIEAARALAKGPRPERSIYFLATTLEESGGFMGATYFAETPPSSIKKVAAVLNVDSTAIHPAGLPVAILGRGRFPPLDKVIDDTSRSLGRTIDLDDEANVMIERQDGWAFTQRGTPSVMASGSFSDMKVLMGYLGKSYHKPNDDVSQPIELGGTVEDANLHVALLRALADPKIYPTP